MIWTCATPRPSTARLFFEPPTIDDRIINQFAYFSVLSNPQLSMDDWLQMPALPGR